MRNFDGARNDARAARGDQVAFCVAQTLEAEQSSRRRIQTRQNPLQARRLLCALALGQKGARATWNHAAPIQIDLSDYQITIQLTYLGVIVELKTARLTVLIDPAKKAAFERLCAQQDVTPSQVVRRLIRDYLTHHGVSFVPSGGPASRTNSRAR
jgi:Ribbon-helix-helix protein